MKRSFQALLAGWQRNLRFLRGNYRLVLAWPVAALLLGAAAWHSVRSDLRDERTEAEVRAQRQADILARSYSDQVARGVAALDQIALQVRYHWDLSNGKFQLNDDKAKAAFPPMSNFRIAIFGPDGVLMTGTLPSPATPLTTQNEFFAVHRTATEDSLYIGQPVSGRIVKGVVVPFSRRLQNKDGSFGGAVVVFVPPAFFTGSYNEVSYGKHGLLGIVGNDSLMRALRIGSPKLPWVGDKPPIPAFPLMGNSTLLEGERWFPDRRDRYIGWSPVQGYPLVALTGLDYGEALAPYLAFRTSTLNDAWMATLVLAGFTLAAMGLSLRLAWRKQQMAWTRAAYRLATEHGKEGFYIAHAVRGLRGGIVDFRVVDCNQRGAEMFLHRRDELIGKTVSSVYEGADPERIIKLLCDAMEARRCETELEVLPGGPFTARWAHLTIVRAEDILAITIRDVSDAKAHLEALERQSYEDALTGLPNRHWVQTFLPKALGHAAARDGMLATLFIDLDGFKAVNDTMGHAAGDEVLSNTARRLKEAVRPHDKVARLGGDEFLVILENIGLRAEAAHVAERILHAFRDGFKVSQGVHPIGVSIGISVYPSDGAEATTLLHHADIAMYSVKTTGKGNYRFYDRRFYESLRAGLEREAELRQAVEQDQFVMYYQPRVDITTGATSSMEALVRWAHPTKGLIGPLEFIPLAEESGLILRLGELVIDKVCAQLAYWAERGQELVPVSVNVSSRQMNEVDVARILGVALSRHRIDPRLLEVELTESSMMGDSEDVANALAAIQKMGITLLVDDFGTGYSSLSQLQRLDFDVLKVDRAFTAELGKTDEGKVFFTAIITMAHALGMRVVAEGVESLEQARILKSLKCDEMQGFFISRPLPPAECQPVLPRWLFPAATS
ncbi:MAG: bifunctional diguanylate cyclase/phosphodiesterase [Noviherbaspirillum sp.]